MRARPHTSAAVAALMLAAVWPGLAHPPQKAAPPKPMLGDNSAGSRGQPAHIIALRDPEGDTIQPEDRRPLPFSTRQTCGASCHDVATISRGWHFNAALAGVPPGRKGQPWFFVDRETATEIPLSYRSWPGTYQPSQLGLSNWGMTLRFGGRMAGGPDASRDREGAVPVPRTFPRGQATSGSPMWPAAMAGRNCFCVLGLGRSSWRGPGHRFWP